MLVSVIIPCYNVEEYISTSIESVLKQTHSNIELICVDNNSSDKTGSILEQYKSNYPNRIFVCQELKPGASAARNSGFQRATGEWVQFLDADDILDEKKIEHQLNIIEQSKTRLDIVIGNYRRKYINNTIKEIYSQKEDVWEALLNTRMGITSSLLWRKEKLKEVNGWNEDLKSSQEYDLLFRVLKSNAVCFFDAAIYTTVVERAGGAISQKNKGENWLRYCELRKQIIEYIVSFKKIDAEKLNNYYQLFFDSIRSLYPYYKKEALQYYQIIPNDFKLKPTNTTTQKYIWLYKILGFKIVEDLKMIVKI